MGLPLLLFLAIAAAAASTPKASTGLPAGEFPQAAIAIANQQTDNNLMDTIAAMANTTHKGDIVSFRTLLGNQWRSSAGFAFVPDAYDGSVPLPLLVYFPNVVPANKGSKDKEGSPGEAALSQLDESIVCLVWWWLLGVLLLLNARAHAKAATPSKHHHLS